MPVKKINTSYLIVFLVFATLASSSYFLPGEVSYVFMALVVVFSFLFSVIGEGRFFYRKKECAIALSFAAAIILSWAYGALVAAFNGVSEKYIFRNFLGMLFYVIVFSFFLIRPDPWLLMRAVFLAFFVQLLYGLVSVYNGNIGGVDWTAIKSISELRSVYSVGYVVAFPVFSASLYSVINSSYSPFLMLYGIKSASLLLFFSLFVLVVPAMSKGFVLGVLVIGALIFISTLGNQVVRGRINLVFFLVVVFFFAILACSVYYFYDVLVYSFGGGERSNSVRMEQAGYLLGEVSFSGAGLGAGLDSGYMRGDIPYAFELSYLSIIHKLGFFSAPLLASYVYVFLVSFLGMLRGKNGLVFSFVLGLMGYSIVGAGNPIILGGLCVMLHSISLYLVAVAKGEAVSGLVRPV
ncbi:hypothetical protein [Halomonas sp. H5]|uniref:hypothetical protein n=1 Tax=Halomonas sp. H5 TaxID=3423910 RepID=UPI003D36BA23